MKLAVFLHTVLFSSINTNILFILLRENRYPIWKRDEDQINRNGDAEAVLTLEIKDRIDIIRVYRGLHFVV